MFARRRRRTSYYKWLASSDKADRAFDLNSIVDNYRVSNKLENFDAYNTRGMILYHDDGSNIYQALCPNRASYIIMKKYRKVNRYKSKVEGF